MKLLSRFSQFFFTLALSLTLVMCTKKEEAEQSQVDLSAALKSGAPTEEVSTRGTASAAFGGKSVSINYGRPQLKGRDMLAQAKEGTVWRMGMNEATEIKTEIALKFGETVIPAGSYSLWMKKVSADKWELIFNKKTGIWGHEHPSAEDLAAVPMSVSTNANSVEVFTIEVTGDGESSGEIKAMWGKSIVAAAFTIAAKATAQ